MFYCDSVEQSSEYTRKGVAKTLKVTEGGNKVFSKVAFNEKTKGLEVVEGTTIVCMCEAVGIHEDAIVEFIVMDDKTIIATLLEGSYYIRDVHGRCVQVDTDGNTVLYDRAVSKKKVYWIGKKELERFVQYKLNKVYNLPVENDCRIPAIYLYNLRFTLKMSYKDNITFCCNCEMVEETLGSGELPMSRVLNYTPLKSALEKAYKQKGRNSKTDVDDVEEDEYEYTEEELEVDESEFEDDYDDTDDDDEY